MKRERILITGPGGRVGPHITPYLRQRYALRLLDLKEIPLEGDDEFIKADIRETDKVEKACEGCKAVVHLAAISDEDDFLTKLMPINIEGAYSVFEASRRAQVPKLIFTSTGQTVLSYGLESRVDIAMPTRPSTIYACTKLFGEALARYYHDHHAMGVICVRLCWFQGYDSPLLRSEKELRKQWISPRDFAQFLCKSIESPVRFGVYFCISNNQGRTWDISNAEKELSYHPEDDSSVY